MAAIVPVITNIGQKDSTALRVVWTPVTEADTCVAVSRPEYSDKSVQVLGTFGGASIGVSGSNDEGVTYAALNDPTGTVIAISAAGIKAVLENTEYFKPLRTGGSSTSLTIAMTIKLGVRPNNG